MPSDTFGTPVQKFNFLEIVMNKFLTAVAVLVASAGVAAACPNSELGAVQSYNTSGSGLSGGTAYSVTAGGN